MDQIAKAANVSKQTVYSHFKNKDELFRNLHANWRAERELSPFSVWDMNATLEEELVKFGVKLKICYLMNNLRRPFKMRWANPTHIQKLLHLFRNRAMKTTKLLSWLFAVERILRF